MLTPRVTSLRHVKTVPCQQHERPLPLCDIEAGSSPGDDPRSEKYLNAAKGNGVRLGGGVATVREFLDADLVDTMHIVVAPVELGRGERLWQSPDELLDRFNLDTVPNPCGVTHLPFWRE